MAKNLDAQFEKILDAPKERVWKAWTDPKQVKNWWGPDNVTIPECEIDLRVGGRIYIVMMAGEAMGAYKGTRWPMEGKFTKVEPLSRLTYTGRAWTEGQGSETQIDQITDVSFEDQKGKTKVTIKVTITNADTAPKAAMAGMSYGFNQQLEKLAKFVAPVRAAS